MRSAITLATLLLTTGSAAAHSGHGVDGSSFGFIHYATEPHHLGTGAAVALLAAISIAAVRRARTSRPQPALETRRAPHRRA